MEGWVGTLYGFSEGVLRLFRVECLRAAFGRHMRVDQVVELLTDRVVSGKVVQCMGVLYLVEVLCEVSRGVLETRRYIFL